MSTALFYFAANTVALTASLLLGAGVLISNPRSFNARIFVGVTVSSACYLVGRTSYAVPADVQLVFWIWPYLLILMNMGPGFWMILAYSLFQDDKRIPGWIIAAFAVQFLLSATNAFGYVGIAQDSKGPQIAGETFVTMTLARRDGSDERMVPLRGVSARSFDVRPELTIVRGRNLELGRFELIAGTGVAAEFDGLDIGDSVAVKGSAWKVVGHFETGGARDSELWADVDLVNAAWGRGSTFSVLYTQLVSADSFQTLEAALAADRRLTTSIFRETDYYAAQSRDTHRLMSAVAAGVTVIMAIGAVFAALHTMYAAVSTRTVEIATLRALGFDRLAIVVSVIAEALALALAGAIVGAALAYTAFNGYQASTMGGTYTQVAFSFDISWSILALGLGISFVLGLIGGVAPAARAVRLPIIAGLRGG